MENYKNLKKDYKVYFLGAGGISMSALAVYLKKQNNLMLKEINLIKKTNQISSLENSYFRKFNLKKLHWLFSDIKNNDPNSNSTKIKENEIEIEKQISILSQLKMIENNLIEQIKDIKEKIAQLEKQKDSNLV